jgi:rubredoxin
VTTVADVAKAWESWKAHREYCPGLSSADPCDCEEEDTWGRFEDALESFLAEAKREDAHAPLDDAPEDWRCPVCGARDGKCAVESGDCLTPDAPAPVGGSVAPSPEGCERCAGDGWLIGWDAEREECPACAGSGKTGGTT